MAWFNFIKAEGYFDPEKNPEPIHVKDGFQIPYWESLSYLEKLSIQIKAGNELEFIDEIISIIKNVSEHPKDNYRTWFVFMKILKNIPNEKIPKEIFHFIPNWLIGKFDTALQSSELCENILPKFLNEAPTNGDIEKAEIILQHIFEIEKTEINPESIWDGEGNSFRSRVYLHYLSDALVEKKLISKIVQHCSNEIILNLGITIKKLLLDYPKGINSFIKDGEKEYEIKTLIEGKNLLISSRLKGMEVANATSTLLKFEDLDGAQFKQQLVAIIKQEGINYEPTDSHEDTYHRINFALNNDLTSSFGFNAIHKLSDKYHNGEKVLEVFSLIFRDLLDEKTKQNSAEATTLLKTVCNNKNYRLPFYKRIALYVISENWNETKSLFWELIKDTDAQLLFSRHQYQNELYELLRKNQQFLSSEEKVIIQNIIDKGPQEGKDDRDEKYSDYWQLRWYAALKDIEPFKEKYQSLSKSLNITNEHYENLGEVRVRMGSVSPFSVEQVLQMDNKKIANYIQSFKPKDHWEEPTIDRLANVIEKAVEAEPQKFSDEIELYNDAYYIYTYHILNGFREAWKNKKSFNWQKILGFCQIYISNEKFYSGKLNLQNDGWNSTVDWVVGSIANLLTEGMQNDKNAFDLELLPTAKEILKILISNLKTAEDFKETNMDYPTYSLNSTAGKVLRAVLDYSLRRTRTKVKYDEKRKWETEIKGLFEGTFEKEILDGYILEGMYFEQFYFLDKEWIIEQVKNNYKLEDRNWLAFIGGFAFGNPPFNKEIYQLFYPHYEKAINNNVELKSFCNNGLIRHIVAFYFWGYEDLKTEGLVLKFLNTATPNSILEFVNFIWRQEAYLKSLGEQEKEKFEITILELWNYLAEKYQDPKGEEEQKVLGGLTHLIVFVPELSESNTDLILKSSRQINKHFYTHELVENLIALKGKGNLSKTAEYIGKIVSSISFNDYLSDFDSKHIIELVTFLYQNGQKEIANIFCNKLSRQGNEFLKPVYNNYNP